MARPAVIDDVWVRTFTEDFEWRQRTTGGTWHTLPFTPPTEAPAPDNDFFDDRNGVADGSFTLNGHHRWTEGDNAGPSNVDLISILNGVLGFNSVPTGSKRLVTDFGVDATDVIRITGTFGPDPASGVYVAGVALACEGANQADVGLHFAYDEVFGGAYALTQMPGATNLGVFVSGSAPTVGQFFSAELGPADNGNYYFLGKMHNGNRFGPFVLPSGLHDNTIHGLIFSGAFGGGTNVGRPIGGFRCESAVSTLKDAALLTSPFSNAAGTVHAMLSDQGHVSVRTGSTLEFSGTGFIYCNLGGLSGSGGGQATPNTNTWLIPHRDVDITCFVSALSAAGARAGPVAHCGTAHNQDHLFACISETSGSLQLRKRVANVDTTLATVNGKTVNATFRGVRMAIKWPNVKVYYDGETTPSINYNLTSTDQSDLGGGTRQYHGAACTKVASVPSPQITSINIAAEGSIDMSPYISKYSMGTDNYEGNTFTSSSFPSDIASDGSRQVAASCRVISGVIKWGVRVRTLPSGAFGAWTEVTGIPGMDDADNHPSCVVAIDGSGRVHFFGGMHDDAPAQYRYSNTGYDLSTWNTPTFPAGMLTAPISAAGAVTAGHYTYPQMKKLGNGNIVFTNRHKFSNTGQGQQGIFHYNHTTNTFTNLGVGNGSAPQSSPGVFINGDTVGGFSSDRGPYMGGMNQFFDDDSWGLMWLWCREVADGTGEEPDPPANRRYSNVSYIRTDDGGVNWTTSSGANVTNDVAVPGTNADHPMPLADSANHGLDNSFVSFIDSAGRPAAIVYVDLDYPTVPHRLLYRVDNSTWTNVGLDVPIRRRNLCPFSYGGRDFIFGKHKDAAIVILIDITIGSPKFGLIVATLYDGPNVITNGWHPQYDRERLAAAGRLSFVPRASWNDGLGGAFTSVPVELVDFNVGQAITDGII